MRIKTLISPFMLSLALSFPIVHMSLEASAVCTNPCGCGNCAMKQFTNPPCQCPGESGCPRCAYDSDSLPLQAFTGERTTDLNLNPDSLAITGGELNMTERVTAQMRGGTCMHQRVALSLFGNAADDLKFVTVRFD